MSSGCSAMQTLPLLCLCEGYSSVFFAELMLCLLRTCMNSALRSGVEDTEGYFVKSPVVGRECGLPHPWLQAYTRPSDVAIIQGKIENYRRK